MHSVTPYLLKSFNQVNSENKQPEHFPLSNIRNKDLLILLNDFFTSKSAHVYEVSEEKKVYKFSDIKCDTQKRYISAFFVVGSYGVKSDILDKKTGKVRFPKQEDDAEVLRHFIMFTVPKNSTEAIALFHKSHGVGIKSLFDLLFKPIFRSSTNAVLQINPYSHTDTISEWAANARVKEFIVSGYVPSTDVAENIALLGDCNTEFRIKPKIKKRGVRATLGSLMDYINPTPNSVQSKIISHSEALGSSVKAVADLNGITRTFFVGSNSKGVTCDILFGDDEDEFGNENIVEIDGGQPKLKSIRPWAIKLTNDILKGVYGKKAYQIS